MEVLEFMKQKNRMCDYYVDGCTRDSFCEICPAHDIDCEITTDKLEQLVAIVEQWVKEHPEKPEQERQKPEQERQKPEQERQKPEQERQKPEQERQKPEQDDIEGAIYREIISHKTLIENLEHDVAVIWHNLDELADQIYALREKVYHTPAKEPSQTPEPSQTQKTKRTRKDVLLAAFPDAHMDYNGCPDICTRALDKNYNNCNDFASCSVCRCAYWLSEVEE